ncbi:MAG: S41 family peptidase [Prevotellaceae bacterium]|nr:S41 family peptidase [Prevotellaceae bacterium]
MKQIIAFLFALLAAVPVGAQTDNERHFDASKNMEIFTDIYKYLDLMYVDSLDANEVIGNGITAMLKSLDPYTVYYPESDVKNLKTMLTGKYAGVGSLIRYNQQLQRVVIDEPYEGMPAAEAGLRKGDIILSIDDTTMTDKDVSFVSSHLRGEAGSSFVIKVKRPSTGKVLKMKITRRAIQMPFLPYYGMMNDHIGYLNLNSFTENCSKDVRRSFIDLKKQGARALVFDLRNNGGGSVQEAVNIVNMFVPKNTSIVNIKGRLDRVNRDYKTTVEPIDTVMPIVVLVNENTASASEITSGSLQDLDRAVILGTRTFGKGLVQTPVDIVYNGQLKLTTAKYYIPSGRCIQAINYKHAHGGYVEHVADSLTRVFHTADGRVVRDGGGIKPDVEVEPDSLPNICYYLAGAKDSSEVMLNYVVDYIAKHPTIAQPKDFTLSDADYADFKARVLKSNFKYDRETEKYLKELVKLAKFEGYYDDAKPEFDALQEKLKHNVAKDLDFNKDKVKQLLEADIVAAYYYQKGAIEQGLRYDKQLKEAEKVLDDTARYNKLLGK